MIKKTREYVIYAVIIALQLAVMLYWASAKTNYFIDELYSFERAVSYSGQGNSSYYIQLTPDWKMNEWMSNAELKKYLIVSKEEHLLNLPFLKWLKLLFKGRSYNGLLNIAMSLAGYSIITSRPGIALNMIFFILAEIFLLRLITRLKMSAPSKAFALAMFGFSGYVIGIVEYIRFYSLVIWLLLVILNLYHVVWSQDKLPTIIAGVVGIYVLIFFSYNHTELTIPYFGAMSVCFIIGLIRTKKWKQVISYSGFMLLGGIYVISSTDYLQAVLNPAEYTGSSVVSRIAENLLHPSFDAISYYFTFLKGVFAGYYFGHSGLLALAVITVLLYLIFAYKVVTIDFRKLKMGSDSAFILVIAIAAIIYTMFAAIEDFSDGGSRYNFFNFVCATIVFWYIVDRLTVKIEPEGIRKRTFGIIAFWILIIALMPFVTRNVEYIYESDADFKARIEQHSDEDVVLYVKDLDGDITNHELYDCVHQMPDESSIFAVDLLTYQYDKVAYPDSFVLWSKDGYDLDLVISDLRESGYSIEDLGVNHVSCAYYVTR
ncbi:hypothetical protein [Butyrivibrio sp. AE2032]|uniref:hypothetical protein n=1 Tax=Butyrivibrio sp. AE2032 TaxID=1458463 RepID=UPI00054E361B|nr:hypothetical protein [Butyrivibrio sp. AE2032]